MFELADKVYEDALALPTDDRLKLIDKLLHSTNIPTNPEIDRAWIEEIVIRNQKLEDGTAKLIPGEEVFEKIKKKFTK